MENKNVGFLIIGIAILIIFIVFLFNSTLKEIVSSSCTLAHGGEYCPMYDTISQQTYLALAIVGVLIVMGLVLIFSKPEETIVIKTRTVEKKRPEKIVDLSKFNRQEKLVYNTIKENKAVFQADLIEKTQIGKVKMSRILDRLEGHGFIERKRRGMNNVVVLKED